LDFSASSACHTGAVAHELQFDVRVDLVEAFLVGLDLVGLERGVDQQLGFLRQGGSAGQGQAQGGKGKGGNGHAHERLSG
jgi:hypothetical protein